MKFEISYKLSIEDYKNFTKDHSRKGMSKYFERCLDFFFAFITLFLAYMMICCKVNFQFTFLIAPLYYIFRLLEPFLMGKINEKVFNTNKIAQKENKVLITENEIEMSSENGTTKYFKDDIYFVFESGNYLYIYIAKNQAVVFSEKFFESPEQFNEFKDFVKNNYCNEKIKYKKITSLNFTENVLCFLIAAGWFALTTWSAFF